MTVEHTPKTRFRKVIEFLKQKYEKLDIKEVYEQYTVFHTEDVRTCQHRVWWKKIEVRKPRKVLTICLTSDKKHCSVYVYGKDFHALGEELAKTIDSVLGEDFKISLDLSEVKEYDRCYDCEPTYSGF